jgi:hypothetical protein
LTYISKSTTAIAKLSSFLIGLGTTAETRISDSKNTCEIDDKNQNN